MPMPIYMYPTMITGTAILGVTGVKLMTMPPTVAAVRIATIGKNSCGDTSTWDNNALRDLSPVSGLTEGRIRDVECTKDNQEREKS